MQNQQMCGILEKKLLVLYTNADSLLNKLEELNLVICDQESKPHVIAVTESKPKNIQETLQLRNLMLMDIMFSLRENMIIAGV